MVQEYPDAQGFFAGIEIRCGKLLVDPQCPVSDLLHEAGHLAIVPGRFRHLMNKDLESGWAAMFEVLSTLGLPPESWLYQAALHVSDTEATAWAWAAGKRLGLAGTEIIRAGDYDGDEDAVRYLLDSGTYEGVYGLAAAGFCSVIQGGGNPVFPNLAFWTQETESDSAFT